MTTLELQAKPSDASFVSRVEPDGGEFSVYGPVEIAWYPDRLEITALGAGHGSMIETRLSGCGEDVVVEIRLPSLHELADAVPGAD